MASITLAVCGLIIMVPFIRLRIQRKHVAAIILKVCTSTCFILSAGVAILSSTAEQWMQNKYLFFGVLFGEVCGLLGDYWLDMKDMHTKHHDTYVFAGFSSFFVGHLFFIAGLFITYGTHWKQLLIALAAGVALALFVLVTEKPMKLRYGKFKGITVGYTFIFGVVTAAAFCSWCFGGMHLQALVMALGLVVFLLSDLVLSGTYFGGKKRPVDYALNHIFYYVGQFTIALSLLAIGKYT